MHKTKIVCTLGPSSDKKAIIKSLIKNGMNFARLNFSHGDLAYHGRLIKNVRSVAKELKMPVTIIQDLQGPRIRIGDIGNKKMKLKDGASVILGAGKIPVTYEKMYEEVEEGQRILIAGGLVELRVEHIKKGLIYCRVVRGGVIGSHKGINLPDTKLGIDTITSKDEKDLRFGVSAGVDFIALSFVARAEDVEKARKLVKAADKKAHVKILAKVERKEAIKNIDEIIDVADGIMIARGDLGIELPEEDVPLLQKIIIDKCLAHKKFVIVATQMLESMVASVKPTQAEVSDVANAVEEGASALMLSEETAVGKYPAETVDEMKKIIKRTEKVI